MKKTKIVIASVLNPVDDTRMYEKFGLSMSQTNQYDIKIIGFSSKYIPNEKNIQFYPLFNFSRLSLKRVFAPIKLFSTLKKIKPEILIVNTHEIIFVGLIYKLFYGCKLLYDIRENYYRNINHTISFPKILRPFIAAYVRGKEYFSTLFIDHYILAEKAYEKEFSFSKGQSTVLENKYKPVYIFKKPVLKNQPIQLIFTGTLAESTGIFQAINLAKKLHQFDANIQLKIVGFCAIPNTLKLIKKEINSLPYITLIGGEKHVPHKEIIREIYLADFGIIYYPENLSTVNSTPTKLYEYLGIQLPILLQNHAPWASITESHNASIIVDFSNLKPVELLEKMNSIEFYNNSDCKQFLWDSEQEKLLILLKKLSN